MHLARCRRGFASFVVALLACAQATTNEPRRSCGLEMRMATYGASMTGSVIGSVEPRTCEAAELQAASCRQLWCGPCGECPGILRTAAR